MKGTVLDGAVSVAAHRVVSNADDDRFPLRAENSEPKFYGDGLCKENGRCGDDNPYTGWSLWHPHAVPASLLNELRASARCVKLQTSVRLPDDVRLVYDRTYTVVAASTGAEVAFEHYLLVPARAMTRETLRHAGGRIKVEACEALRGAAAVHFDDRDVDGAVTAGYAAEWCLRQCAADASLPPWRRGDPALLAARLGTHDVAIERLASESPWAAAFVLDCVRAHEARAMASRDRALLEHHPIAKAGLELSGLDDVGLPPSSSTISTG
jgi:hypothetical protein